MRETNGSQWAEVATASGVAVVTSLAFGLVFSYRTDYLGHFIAGFGGTLGLVTFGRFLSSWKWLPFVLTLVAISIGIGAESSIFRLAIFDSVDFFNQSLGAALACCASAHHRPRLSVAALTSLVSFTCVLAGFYSAFA